MSDQFVGQILLFPFNFPPKGFAFCQGQLLPISQNTALFSLLGTMYGGNGISNFALPNLQGCVAMGFGQGPGLTFRSQGDVVGLEAVTLSVAELPAHSHAIDISALTATARCKNGAGNQSAPAGNVPAIEAAGLTATYSDAAPNASMHSLPATASLIAAPAGGSQPHDNRQPYLALNYCIALQGVFPPRS
jgi:microcystin-dependent protein